MSAETIDLSGRVALVTGGGRGIGRAVALALGRAGAAVAVNYRRDEDAAAQVVKDITAAGGTAGAYRASIGDLDALDGLVSAVSADLGPIDILVNNAGTTWGAATLEHPLEAWHKVVALNLTAMFVITQEVGRRSMVPRRRGKIINIASILGLVGGGEPGRAPTLAYNTTKGGVISFTRSLAVEFRLETVAIRILAPIGPTHPLRAPLAQRGDGLYGVVLRADRAANLDPVRAHRALITLAKS